MKKLAIISLMLASYHANAETKTDQAVGNCVAYFAASQKETGARDALGLADNQTRALKYADLQMKEFMRYKNDKSLLQSALTSAAGDCREIGLKTSQY